MIRDGKPDDAAEVARLLGELGYPTNEATARLRIERLLARGDTALRVDAQGESLRGLGSLQLLAPIEEDTPVGHITALVVSSDAQRQGIGRALVEDLLAFARARGCARVSVGSGLHRAGAHAFYESIGFTRSGIRFKRVL